MTFTGMPSRGRLIERAVSFSGRHYAVPVLVALLMALVGAQIALIFKVPSWANDEPAHIGYVAALAQGQLPTINTDIVDDPARFPRTAAELQGWDEAHGDIWTANHPPAFHVAMVPVWWLLSDHQSGMVITMRLINTLGFAVWLVLVGVLARELVPHRPAVAALAVVVAATPSLVLRSAFFINDGWAGVAALVMLLMTIRILRRGVQPEWVAAAALAGSFAAGMRAQGVLLVAVCTVTVFIALRRGEGTRRALLVAGLVGGIPALASGWFYLRNLRLYGDLTGQEALLAKFERAEVASFAQIFDVPGLSQPTLSAGIVICAFLILVPVALLRALRAGRVRLDAAWYLLIAHALVTALNLVNFVSAGGGFHDRYLMHAMPLLATVTAVGMLEVGRWWRAPTSGTAAYERREWRCAAGWSTVLLLWLIPAVTWLERYHIFDPQDSFPVEGPVPESLLFVALLVGVAIVGVMLIRARQVVGCECRVAALPRPSDGGLDRESQVFVKNFQCPASVH